MKNTFLILFVTAFFFFINSQESELEKYKRQVQAEKNKFNDQTKAERDAYDAQVEKELKEIEARWEQNEKEWQAYTEKERKEWMEYVKGVRKKWGEFSDTTPTSWSNYGNNFNSLSKVDFATNKVEVAAIVETDDPKAAETLIEKQIEIMLNEKAEGTNTKFMEGQIAFEKANAENEKKIIEMQKEFDKKQAEIEKKAQEEMKAVEQKRLEQEKKFAEEKKAIELKKQEEEQKKHAEKLAALEKMQAEAKKKIEEEKAQIEKKELEKIKALTEQKAAEEKSVVKSVDLSNSKEFVKETVNKNVKKEVVVGEDGKKRTKYSVTLDMVPNNVQKRAEAYLEKVKEYSAKNDLDPSLVLALIHTESAFNPKAFSRKPDGTPMACGLMQIIPSQAGRDAHKALFGKDKMVEPEYLFDPENNLNMGTWYLKNLTNWWNNYEKKKFGKTSSTVKNEFFAISSYNQGMGTILNKAYKTHDLIDKSEDETYKILTTETAVPKEGRDYLKRVADRKKLYKVN